MLHILILRFYQRIYSKLIENKHFLDSLKLPLFNSIIDNQYNKSIIINYAECTIKFRNNFM